MTALKRLLYVMDIYSNHLKKCVMDFTWISSKYIYGFRSRHRVQKNVKNRKSFYRNFSVNCSLYHRLQEYSLFNNFHFSYSRSVTTFQVLIHDRLY